MAYQITNVIGTKLDKNRKNRVSAKQSSNIVIANRRFLPDTTTSVSDAVYNQHKHLFDRFAALGTLRVKHIPDRLTAAQVEAAMDRAYERTIGASMLDLSYKVAADVIAADIKTAVVDAPISDNNQPADDAPTTLEGVLTLVKETLEHPDVVAGIDTLREQLKGNFGGSPDPVIEQTITMEAPINFIELQVHVGEDVVVLPAEVPTAVAETKEVLPAKPVRKPFSKKLTE